MAALGYPFAFIIGFDDDENPIYKYGSYESVSDILNSNFPALGLCSYGSGGGQLLVATEDTGGGNINVDSQSVEGLFTLSSDGSITLND